ncbi:hypothetical protein OG870_17495 [Streptomyces sp. NBC_00461]|uniref:hypothetical protein n=1 Tax=Streptomyces sp. NBC_00461 TaxID=2975750 RepID=UPI002E17F5D8
MTYTDEDIKRYQDLCQKYFNEDVEPGQAAEELNELIFMVSLMYHPELQDRIDVENSALKEKPSRKRSVKGL